MSWWSDKEEVSRWYLERTGDGLDYPSPREEDEDEEDTGE